MPINRQGGSALAILRIRDFRFLLMGQFLTGSLSPIIFVAQILWVLEQAPDGWEIVMVGAIGTLRGIGTIGFGLYAGALADRYDRRRLLMVLQAGAILLALTSAAVTQWLDGTVVGVALFYLLTLGVSAVQPADQATRNAVVSEVLGQATQRGLGALQFIWQMPALFMLLFSGEIITTLGFGGTFLLIGAVSASNMLLLIPLRYRTQLVGAPHSAIQGFRPTALRAIHDVRDGMRFARRDSVLFWAILLLVVSQAATFPAVTNLAATWLTEVLDEPATNFGKIVWPWLLSGALASLILVGLPNLRHKVRGLILGAALFPIGVLVFSLPRTLTSAFVAYFGFGSSQSTSLVSTVSLVQERVPNEMRGRVMSLVQLNEGAAQLLTLPLAAIGQVVSLTVLFPVIGFGSLFLVLAIVGTHPSLWNATSAPKPETIDPSAG
jgi:MFS family permease